MTIDPDLTISVTPVSLHHNTFVDAIFLHVYRLFVNPPNPTVNALYKIPPNTQYPHSLSFFHCRTPLLYRRVAEQERHTLTIMRPSTRLRQPVSFNQLAHPSIHTFFS